MKYQIQVTDEDGLHLPHPMDGYIRIKIDRPPTIAASVDVQYFLPNTGMPEIVTRRTTITESPRFEPPSRFNMREARRPSRRRRCSTY